MAAAQIQSTLGDILGNMRNHVRFVQKAIDEDVDLIVFPEMSITGYCREDAEKLAFLPDDHRLEELIHLSDKEGICIVAGAPIKMDHQLFIGSFIIQPNQKIKIYTKQYLHSGEEKYFNASFDYNPQIQIQNHNICFAICADIATPDHPRQAALNGANLYVASIFYSPQGLDKGIPQLCSNAQVHHLKILVSNFVGEQPPFKAGGKSCFVDQEGNVERSLGSQKEELLTIHV